MQYHSYHLVTKSLWPSFISINLLSLLISLILIFKGFIKGYNLFLFSLLLFTFILYFWINDIIIESTYYGYHTLNVIKGLLLGIILFICSETMLFFAIFWAYFHNSLFPSVEIGLIWPSFDINNLNPFELPLLNTILLLTSASLVTISHHLMNDNNYNSYLYSVIYLTISIVLIFLFIYFQYIEYINCSFDISDSIFGSIFFFGTTFHGIHVFVAGIWLLITLIRLLINHQSSKHHINLISSLWYFHFTDIVWIILYGFFYLWTFN